LTCRGRRGSGVGAVACPCLGPHQLRQLWRGGDGPLCRTPTDRCAEAHVPPCPARLWAFPKVPSHRAAVHSARRRPPGGPGSTNAAGPSAWPDRALDKGASRCSMSAQLAAPREARSSWSPAAGAASLRSLMTLSSSPRLRPMVPHSPFQYYRTIEASRSGQYEGYEQQRYGQHRPRCV
jgi:hypothetical protein